MAETRDLCQYSSTSSLVLVLMQVGVRNSDSGPPMAKGP